MLITKEDLIRTNEAYWNIVNRARELLYREHPTKDHIDVDEIHVDPEEGYVFVSWEWWNKDDHRETSTSYRINKFLSLINKDEKVDHSDLIPVELKGVNK